MTVIRLRGVRVEFPGVVALDDVDFDLNAGEVHALAGQNGAGKSTLVRVIVGEHHSPNATFDYQGVRRPLFASPHEAEREGVAIVTQERSLVPQFTVAENIAASQFRSANLSRVNHRTVRQLASAALTRLGVDIDLDTLVGDLRPAEQTLVEIARATASDAAVLLLDEPTSAISGDETDRLFAIIRRACAAGTGVILISHRLSDIYGICDRITILEDGRVKARRRVADLDRAELVRLMSSEASGTSRPAGSADGSPHERDRGELSASLSLQQRGTPTSVRCSPGEILGMFGLVGSGAIEMAYALVGGVRSFGEVTVDGDTISSPRTALAAGVGFVPGDRSESVFSLQALRRNISAPRLGAFSVGPLLARSREAIQAARVRDAFDIRPPFLEREARTFSGGNKQKAVVGRWVTSDIRGVVAVEPTRGVDVGARQTIHNQLRQLAATGAFVVIASTDLDEIVTIADRVIVFADGRGVQEFDGSEIGADALLKAAC